MERSLSSSAAQGCQPEVKRPDGGECSNTGRSGWTPREPMPDARHLPRAVQEAAAPPPWQDLPAAGPAAFERSCSRQGFGTDPGLAASRSPSRLLSKHSARPSAQQASHWSERQPAHLLSTHLARSFAGSGARSLGCRREATAARQMVPRQPPTAKTLEEKAGRWEPPSRRCPNAPRRTRAGPAAAKGAPASVDRSSPQPPSHPGVWQSPSLCRLPQARRLQELC
mmetsp:Transcript_2394/g.5680  ORF Transcript_2394/g.5680 Transcript_2394/m.5680 type:complete len:225 (-) Transcript_2394:434-1108(-)